MANDKVISTQALIEKFQQALADEWGYIWGTAGEKWTAAKQAELEKTTDPDREQGRKGYFQPFVPLFIMYRYCL